MPKLPGYAAHLLFNNLVRRSYTLISSFNLTFVIIWTVLTPV